MNNFTINIDKIYGTAWGNIDRQSYRRYCCCKQPESGQYYGVQRESGGCRR